MSQQNQNTSSFRSTIQSTLSSKYTRLICLFVVVVSVLSSLQPTSSALAFTAPNDMPQSAAAVIPDSALMLPLLNAVSDTRLMDHVTRLEGFGTRHVNSSYNNPTQGIGAARNYIHDQFVAIAAQHPSTFSVVDHNFPVSWYGVNSTATNVVGILTGTDASAGVVVIGAHYDSTASDYSSGTMLAPGANDNASGTAAVLEIARVMAQGEQPRRTVLFVAFSAEEIGRLGSIAFVNEFLPAHNMTVSAMIDLDIIGSCTGPNGEYNDTQVRLFSAGPDNSPSRQLARTLMLVNELYPHSLQIVVQNAVDRQGRYSDHISFNEGGFPAIRFIEPMEEQSHQHNSSDTSDLIQSEYLTRTTQTALISTIVVAGGLAAPQNLSLTASANSLPSLSWNADPNAASYVVALRSSNSLIYDQLLEVPANTLDWAGFSADNVAAVAIAARDANGLIGPLSDEYALI